MTRRLLFFDLETTGIRVDRARIVELAAAGSEEPDRPFVARFHPGRPIPPDATAVHGITDRDVADAPRFAERAAEVEGLLDGRILCGYNSRKFDTPLLDVELRRAGRPGLDLARVEEVDLYRVWLAAEPEAVRPQTRTLTAAARRYLGYEPADAHRAEADVRVLVELFDALREAHGLAVEEMLRMTSPPDELDREGKLRVVEGEVIFGFGRHRGEPAAAHPDYLDWMLGADFPPDTKEAIRELRQRGFRPPPTA